jgi:hypothetical protein
MPDYIPVSDAEFLKWAEAFTNYLMTNAKTLGVTPAQVVLIQCQLDDFWLANKNYQSVMTPEAKESRDICRNKIEDELRTLVRQILMNPDITNVQRAGLGIPAREVTQTSEKEKENFK